ncbi:hypothetical protein [Microbacterium testaceum]|nr:hypothetical protein [Microbacterium testaceum]
MLESIDDQLATIVAEHEPSEQPSVERIKEQMIYVRRALDP